MSCFSFPKNRLLGSLIVEVVSLVEDVVGVREVVVVIVVGVEVVVDPKDVDAVVAVWVGATKFAGSCATSKAVQSTPMSLPSEAAFL